MSILKGVKINGGFPFDFGAEVDNTLTVEGAPADAKKTGDEIADLKSAISDKLDADDFHAVFVEETAKTQFVACMLNSAEDI